MKQKELCESSQQREADSLKQLQEMREQLAESRRALTRRESVFTAEADLSATQIAHLTRLNKELAEAKRTAENEVLSMQREVAPLRAISTLKASALKTHNELTERILKALRVQVGTQRWIEWTSAIGMLVCQWHVALDRLCPACFCVWL